MRLQQHSHVYTETVVRSGTSMKSQILPGSLSEARKVLDLWTEPEGDHVYKNDYKN